jgi:hypothetical protein
MALLALTLGAAHAAAAPPAAPAPKAAASAAPAELPPPSAEATAAFERLLAAKSSSGERKAAADALTEIPDRVPALRGFLARTRRSTDAERRVVLVAIGAELPDDQGKFKAPARQTADAEQRNDKFDWMAALLELPEAPGLVDVIADVAAMRALATGQDPEGAAAILDFAFSADGMAYRDESGRRLRAMAPWSLPALIRATEKQGDGSKMRYANYQLERLDRQNPKKALSDAPNEQLKVAVLDAFRDSLYREAVYVVLETVDDPSPAVRAAARRTWTEYATGRAPAPAPKERLQLPGGKLADKPTPLWLNSRELADIAIRRQLEALTGTPVATSAKLDQLTRDLYAFYDQRRAAALDVDLERALSLLKDGKAAEAAAIGARILVQAPDLPRRAEIAPIFVAHGDALASKGEWKAAAAAFGKAAATAGPGAVGDEALARHHEARGKAAEAAGASGAVEFAQARELETAIAAREPATERRWMLWVGVAVALAGLALLAVGWSQRRR